MDVEIFRRTVKDRRRGASWDLLKHMAEGIRACGDNPIMVNEHKSGEWAPDEMNPTAKIGCMFGYGGTNQMHHTKGRRRDLVERAKKKGIYIITFDGGLLSSFGNVITHLKHHWRVSLYSPMNNGNFLSDNSPPDRWEMMRLLWKVKYEPWRKPTPDAPILFVLQPKDNWSMNELDPIDWFNDVYKKLRPLTKRKFLVRPHPNHMAAMENRIKEFPKDCEVIIGQKFFAGDEKKHYRFNFQDALNNCYAVVTHNSTASTDSCVRGIPTFVTSNLAICWPVANTDLLKIETPIYPDRTQWVYDLGYKMWTTEEIKNGTVFKRFKEKLGL
jgi:hypothetical protein|tara:strand:+ start:2739 stop:3722 length:984 start_codon:yes stop_codon:yes gene_type:complete